MHDDLAFHTNEELIAELLKRKTFAGVVIRPKGSVEDLKNAPVVEFDMSWTTLLPINTVRTLLQMAQENLAGVAE